MKGVLESFIIAAECAALIAWEVLSGAPFWSLECVGVGVLFLASVSLAQFRSCASGSLLVPVALLSEVSRRRVPRYVTGATSIHNAALLMHAHVAVTSSFGVVVSEFLRCRFLAALSQRKVPPFVARTLSAALGIAVSAVCFHSLSVPSPVAFSAVAVFHVCFCALSSSRMFASSLVPADALVVSHCVSLLSLVVATMSRPSPVQWLSGPFLEGVHVWHLGDATVAICVVICCTLALCSAAPVLVSARRAPAITVAAFAVCAVAIGDRWFARLTSVNGGIGFILWLFRWLFLGRGEATRWVLLGYWVLWLLICAGTIAVVLSDEDAASGKLGRGWRKFFHFVSVAMFAPAIACDIELFRVASCCVACAMLAIEVAGALTGDSIAALSSVRRFNSRFHSHQDSGDVTLTHIGLLVGIGLPAWASGIGASTPSHWLAPYSGVVSVGVGDSVASIVGCLCGRHRWPRSKKTVEGTIGSVVASMLFVCSLWACTFQWDCGAPFPLFDLSVFAAVCLSSLAEAFASDHIDNLVLPFHFRTALILSSK